MVTRLFCSPLRELQHVKPLAIPDSDYSTRDNPDWPDQLLSPDITWIPIQQEQWEAMEGVPTATPRHSGRVSQPLRALEDYELE